MFDDIKTCGSLFSGIGGTDLAMKDLGIKTLFSVEIDRFPSEIYKKRFPDVIQYKDVRDSLIEWRDKVQILVGGFPCTSVSTIGKKEGFKKGSGTHTSLAWAMVDRIKEVSPKYVFAENVENFMNKKFTEEREALFKDLISMGYGGKWAIFGSYEVGANHRRNRFWMLLKKMDNPKIEEMELNHEPVPKNLWSTPRCSGKSTNTFLRKNGKIRDHICDQLVMEAMRRQGFRDEDIFNPKKVNQYLKNNPLSVGKQLYPNLEYIEWMMGFPPNFTTNLAYISNKGDNLYKLSLKNEPQYPWEPPLLTTIKYNTKRMKALGNAQNPICAREIFKKLYKSINNA